MLERVENDLLLRADENSGLRGDMAADAHMSGADRALRAGAGRRKAALDQKLIEPSAVEGHGSAQAGCCADRARDAASPAISS
jgi:hypothetical protein